MKSSAPIIRSFTYRHSTYCAHKGVGAFWIGLGIALTLETGTVFAQPNDRIAPKLPRTEKAEALIEGGIPAADSKQEESDKEIIPELKGLLILSNPDKLASRVRIDPPLVLQGVPLLDNPEVRSKLMAFIGKPLSFTAMNGISKTIVDWYRNYHRPLVDVTFPRQSIMNGFLQVLVTEARIGQVQVQGNQYFSSRQIRAEVQVQKGDILNDAELKDDLDFLNNNPFRHVDAILDKGEVPNTTDIFLKTTDRNPLRLYAGYDNSGSVATGRARWNIGGNYGDALGLGHIASYQFTASSDFWVENGRFMNRSADAQYMAHAVSYTLPLPWRDYLTISGSYSRSHPSIDSNFNQVGEGGQAGFRYDHRFHNIDYSFGKLDQQISGGYDFKTTNNNLEFGGTAIVNNMADLHQLSVGYKATLKDDWGQTSLNNDFVLSPGHLTPGNSNVALENTGVAYAKARYFYDRVDVSRLTPLQEEFLWNSRARFQFSSANLLPSEQLGSNIYDGIRGYTDQPAGSQGFILTQELYLPSFSPTKLMNLGERDKFQPLVFWELAQFADVKRQPGNLASYQLQSLGIGFRYNFVPNFTASVDYAHQLQPQPGRTSGDFALMSATMSF